MYDLVVIGAGPGGYVAAIKAAQLGKNVLLVENREVGGTCLNRGCMPTKALLHSAELFHSFKECERFGVKAVDVSFDIRKIHERKDEVVSKLRTGVEALVKANKIELVIGHATIFDSKTVKIGDDCYKTENILIATGSLPCVPPIEGINCENVVTSDELLETGCRLYKSIVIIGGGVIGVEFASIYSSLGCEVTIIEACDRILPTLDREISQNLSMILKKRGVKIYTAAKVTKITEGLSCEFSCKDKSEAVSAEGILIATGRKANTQKLFADSFDFPLDRGMIEVNTGYETKIPGIFAIGDVIKGGIQLAHVASAQGTNAVCAIFGEEMPINMTAVPSCIYTSPEIATVGLDADSAKVMGIAVKIGKFIMSSNGKTIIQEGDRGFIKVVFDEETEVILGAQMMCSRATDMISELTTAVVNSLTLKELSSVIRPHPTFCEGVTEALEDVTGHSIHTMPKKR